MTRPGPGVVTSAGRPPDNARRLGPFRFSPAPLRPLEATRAAMALSPGGQRLAAVRRVALGLLAQHGLAGWSFGYNRRKASLGVCFHGRKLIELSIHLV